MRPPRYFPSRPVQGQGATSGDPLHTGASFGPRPNSIQPDPGESGQVEISNLTTRANLPVVRKARDADPSCFLHWSPAWSYC